MKLHTDLKFFGDSIRATSQHMNINEEFIEKDYWITFVLSNLAKSEYASQIVFKGGTSLSKGFGLIERFSEDVDIAIIDADKKSGNEIKTIIRIIEKEMTKDMKELTVDGITSKGSRFRKSVFEYLSIDAKNLNNRLIVEVNSFSNPHPFKRVVIKSFVFDFFKNTGNDKYIERYNLQPFEINVLNKEQTMLEKTVSLIRFSFDENVSESISKKIRHFYDLYFLTNDDECISFMKSSDFTEQFYKILSHDRDIFDEPIGWKEQLVTESPLIKDFEKIWKQLNDIYKSELSALAYTPIPDERKVAEQFNKLIKLIQ